MALTAQQIFDSSNAQDNVFASITDLIQGLQNNDDTAISSSLSDVQSADTYLNQQLAFYGTVQDRVTGAQTFGQNYTTQLQTQLSGVQEADEAADDHQYDPGANPTASRAAIGGATSANHAV